MTPTEERSSRSDICVFACTGQMGRNVARLICENAGTSTVERVLLLAGRDVDKVRALHHNLTLGKQQSSSTAVRIVVYPKPVRVDDDEALQALASQTRVLVNCVDVQEHPRALVGVAEACIHAGTHYLDLATTVAKIAPVFALKAPNNCVIVPGCGFDYALPDVAVAVAEQSFQRKYGENPTCVQLLFKLIPGPLGMKWPLHLVSRYFHDRKEPSAHTTKKEVEAPSIPRIKAPIVSFNKHLCSWTIPWVKANYALQFLYYQRTKTATMDARLALPKQAWRLVFYAIYTIAVLLPVLVAVVLAKMTRFYLLQRLLLHLLPALTLGVLTRDDDLRRRAARQNSADFVIVLQNKNKNHVLTFRVSGPCIDRMNLLCLTLAALELAERTEKDDDRGGGILTPAQALLDTGFWTRLQSEAQLQAQSSD